MFYSWSGGARKVGSVDRRYVWCSECDPTIDGKFLLGITHGLGGMPEFSVAIIGIDVRYVIAYMGA